ncbi:MYND-type domain-containing protein [Mycena chlorophos]|uniref:MYND-type domain-containing protein n=1 Tax=Mycena chlorophos TaxID=658473 RepID=A0A8H6TKT6_MYCCL|nr:MYND-type domain-containing protein [Mycena chlorophos]
MHSALRLSNLRRLPRHIWEVAMQALEGSVPALWALDAQLGSLNAAQRIDLLPLVYKIVDSTDKSQILQTTEDSQAASGEPTSDGLIPMKRAAVALKMLATIASTNAPSVIPPVLDEIWPLISSWIIFLDSLRDNLVSRSDFSLEITYRIGLGLLAAVFRVCTSERVRNTPGVVEFFARAWSLVVYPSDPRWSITSSAGTNVLMVLRAVDIDSPEARDRWAEELANGVGGRRALAQLVVAHMRQVLPSVESPLDEESLRQLMGLMPVFAFLPEHDEALCAALWDNGLISMLTILTRALGKQFNPLFHPPLPPLYNTLPDAVFSVLLDGFVPNVGWQKRIEESIHAGLLDAIPRFCAVSPEEFIKTSIIPLLQDYLAPATVFLSVLRALRPDMAMAETILLYSAQGTAAFTHEVLAPVWLGFISLAKERLAIVDEYDSRKLSALRGCSSAKCCRIASKSLLKRCAGCRLMFYCSPACQREDWHSSHRDICALSPLQDDDDDVGTTKLLKSDRAFLRALLNHDAADALSQPEFFRSLTSTLYHDPDNPPFVAFDYRSGRCGLNVDSSARLRCTNHAGCDGDRVMQNHIQRAATSGGRMQLHLIQLRGDHFTRGMRMQNFEVPFFDEWTRRLAMELREKFPNGEATDEDIDAHAGAFAELVQACSGLVQTH